MKQPLNKKQPSASVVKKSTEKTPVSAETSASVKKKSNISASKAASTKDKTSTVRSKSRKPETAAPTGKSKTTNLNKTVSAKKIGASAKTVKSDVKKPIRTVKSKPVISAKKGAAAKPQKPAGKTKNTSKNVSVEKKTPENKKNNQNFKTEKNEKLPTNAAIRKAKAVNSQAFSKIKKTVKSQPKISAGKIQTKNSKIRTKTADAISKTAAGKNPVKKDAAVKRSKVQKPAAKIENKQSTSRISKITKVEDQKIVAVHLVKKLKLPANIIKSKSRKVHQSKQPKLIIKAEQPSPAMPKPKPKKAKAIGSAVFRGEKNKYDFTVFPLDAVFENVPAIYVISRRVVDKSKRAHHALVCIGQTESLLEDLKKHKKDKRAKKFAANSISLLREENENRRLKIETDLKAAHAIRCFCS